MVEVPCHLVGTYLISGTPGFSLFSQAFMGRVVDEIYQNLEKDFRILDEICRTWGEACRILDERFRDLGELFGFWARCVEFGAVLF